MDYSSISLKIGRKLTNEIILTDPSDSELSAGGTQTLIIGMFGTGKSTLMAQFAEFSEYTLKSKIPLMVSRLSGNIENSRKYHSYPTTVIYRLRDSDIWPVLIPENWRTRYPNMRMPKDLNLFVHCNDIDNITFYTFDEAHTPIVVPNIPTPILYTDAPDLISKLGVGAINVVLEPQEYRLSESLIDYIRIIRSEERHIPDSLKASDALKKQPVPTGKRPVGRPRQEKKMRDYSNVSVKPSTFWFDVVNALKTGFRGKPVQCIFDEADDFLSAVSSDTQWWLINDFAEKYRDLRKNNISTLLSTHAWDMLFYAIPKRATYKIMLPGTISTPKFTMIKTTKMFSDLPPGAYIIEKTQKEFGLDRFSRIPSPIMCKVEGLRGDIKGLDDEHRAALKKEYARIWDEQQKPVVGSKLPAIIEI